MGAVSVAVYTIIATYIILNIIQITIGLRVDRNSEV
jgi:ammonia channel protein AmtB